METRKKFLIFQETETLKPFYISGNGNLYLQNPKMKIYYISPKNVLNKFF